MYVMLIDLKCLTHICDVTLLHLGHITRDNVTGEGSLFSYRHKAGDLHPWVQTQRLFSSHFNRYLDVAERSSYCALPSFQTFLRKTIESYSDGTKKSTCPVKFAMLCIKHFGE